MTKQSSRARRRALCPRLDGPRRVSPAIAGFYRYSRPSSGACEAVSCSSRISITNRPQNPCFIKLTQNLKGEQRDRFFCSGFGCHTHGGYRCACATGSDGLLNVKLCVRMSIHHSDKSLVRIGLFSNLIP